MDRYTENKEFSFSSITFNFLKILIDLAFLKSVLRMLHSFMGLGKNAFSKDFVLDKMGFILEAIAYLRG